MTDDPQANQNDSTRSPAPMRRRRGVAGASAPRADEPAPPERVELVEESAPLDLMETYSGPREPAPAPADDAKGAKPKDAKAEPVASDKKAMRAVLLVLIFGVVGFIFYLLLEEETRPSMRQLTWKAPKPITLGGKDHMAKVVELAGLVAAGRAADVVAQADALRKEFAQDYRVLDEVYRAEAVLQVTEIADLVKGMPKPDTKDLTIPEGENVARLAAELATLERVRQQREDWGELLVAAPQVRAAWDQLSLLFDTGTAQLEGWETAVDALTEAKDALAVRDGRTPGYARALFRLRTARLNYASPLLPTLVDALTDLFEAERAVEALDADKAGELLAGMKLGEEPPKGSLGPVLATDIRAWMAERRAGLEGRVKAVGELAAILKTVDAEHLEGQTDTALAKVGEALAAYSATDPLLAEGRRELETRQKHWALVRDRYERLDQADATGSFRDRMAGWLEFRRLLRAGDEFYEANIQDRLASVEREVLAYVDASYARLAEASQGYTGITSEMRRPTAPREAFAVQARALGAMATEANRLLGLEEMIAALPSAETYRPILAFAREVTDSHSRESQRMWNMVETYRRHNQPENRRECLERVLLLGDAPSNKRLLEARQELESGESAE